MRRFPQWRFLAGVILLKISLYYDAPSATAEPSELFPYFQHFFPVFKKVWFFWKNMLTIMVSPDILTNVPSERNKFKANWLGGLAQLGAQATGCAPPQRRVKSKNWIAQKSSKIKGFWQHGGIAQLGERLNGIQEVSGSIPLISTKNNDSHRPNVWVIVLSIRKHKEDGHLIPFPRRKTNIVIEAEIRW